MRGRLRRRAAVVAPVVAGAVAVATGTEVAAAASGSRIDPFTFTSDSTGQEVQCSISGDFSSTARSGGGWTLVAVVRIADGPAACEDGIAFLDVRNSGGSIGTFSGGGSYVEARTTTATEVTSIRYQLFLNDCACYTPEYTAPK